MKYLPADEALEPPSQVHETGTDLGVKRRQSLGMKLSDSIRAAWHRSKDGSQLVLPLWQTRIVCFSGYSLVLLALFGMSSFFQTHAEVRIQHTLGMDGDTVGGLVGFLGEEEDACIVVLSGGGWVCCSAYSGRASYDQDGTPRHGCLNTTIDVCACRVFDSEPPGRACVGGWGGVQLCGAVVFVCHSPRHVPLQPHGKVSTHTVHMEEERPVELYLSSAPPTC